MRLAERIAAATLAVAACTSHGGAPVPAQTAPAPAPVDVAQALEGGAAPVPSASAAVTATGAELYARYCSLCHGDQGQGYAADNANALANQRFLAAVDDEFLTSAIAHGRPGTPMSAWSTTDGGPLDSASVDELARFIRGWQTEPSVMHEERASAGSAMRGQAAYNVHCSACHGEDGSGVTAVSLNNPRFLASASDGYLRHVITQGRPEVGMPAFGPALPSRTIDDVVSLVRGWQRPVDSPSPEPYVPDFANAVINPGGPTPAWTLREDRFVSAEAVHTAIEAGEAVVLVDARATSDFLISHLPGALSLPFYSIGASVDRLPRDVWIVTYCGCPHAASGRALDTLRAAGFERVAVLDEGFYEYVERYE